MKQRTTLIPILTLSAILLFGTGSAIARSNEVGVAKKNAIVLKTGRAERGESNRRENRRHDNSNHRHGGNLSARFRWPERRVPSQTGVVRHAGYRRLH